MKLFQFLRKRIVAINTTLGSAILTFIGNLISEDTSLCINNPLGIWQAIFNMQRLINVIMVVILILLAIIDFIYLGLLFYYKKQSLSNEFSLLMKAYTSDSLKDNLNNGCLSWGEGKTVLYCNDIIYGWKSSNVLIESYNDNLYSFYKENELDNYYNRKSSYPTNQGLLEYVETDSFQKVIRNGNNLDCFMLTDQKTNFDKKNRKLLLSIGRTKWCQTSYIWDFFGKKNGDESNSNGLMKEYAKGVSTGKYAEPYLPNSLCLHLLIETRDNKIIKSRISGNKRNDNPGTWAFTLGEQLDIDDFVDGNNFYPDFMQNWLKRAFKEEYRFSDEMYIDIVDTDSFRILSLDFESDRYNFALLCTVRLNYTFKVFMDKVQPLLSIDEALELESVSLNDVPNILATYNDIKMRKEYHPSSYLRLLVFYIHKMGFGKAENTILDYLKKQK